MASSILNPIRTTRRGLSYFQGRRQGNKVPAILLLFGAVVLVLWLRQGGPPSGQQALTLAIAAGLIVGIGTFAPTTVVALLAALLVAAVFNSSTAVEDFLARVQGQVNTAFGRPPSSPLTGGF